METRAGLSGHAAFETFSVLTRMPGPSRLDAPVAIEVLRIDFPLRCWLLPEQSDILLERCGQIGIIGGSIYDALVGEAARVNQCTLLTRDRRAQRSYELLGVTYEFLG
jgi:predicted nucleic acid-binding protein